MPSDDPQTAIILIDHGSRRAESNDQLLDVVAAYRAHSGCSIVEPAHMELAEPSLATAFSRAVELGAHRVIVVPYFLAPGRHWQDDIPGLAAEAAAPFPTVEWAIAAPLGLHPKMMEIIDDRVGETQER